MTHSGGGEGGGVIETVNIASIAYESAATNFKVSIISYPGITGEGGRPEWYRRANKCNYLATVPYL